ncbi:mitochondrial fission ELM1 family protein [Marinobacter caseinilyticus]|uniref:mitochondrial fission ELM1 family protein n=1 Tax=Marinobacter caseinilyticus TaxID=2692195 RepID=UPI0014082070|nr:ELM1/GtrOC1 family putative glycosyltransferase [Marinobacter caseinilyticus]
MTSQPALSTKAPVVWLLTDNKAGHLNQLKGLGNRLRVLSGASLYWLDTTEIITPLWRALTGIAPHLDAALPNPDLVIAAGTGTHRLLLSLRRKRHARTIVLMKPGFPMRWVDAAIIPEHDDVRPDKHTLITEGVLNAITPMARLTDKPEALVLIGGPSRHYEWDDDLIFDQLMRLMQTYPQWRWTISSSRRTPDHLKARLEALAGPKTTVTDPERTHANWLPHTLAASRAIWVTPDSTSMVFEALTSGVPTGLFELPTRPQSRLAKGVAELVARGRVAHWRDHHAIMEPRREVSTPLWEADRAAHWLIDRYLSERAS